MSIVTGKDERMSGKEDQKIAESYQSDQGETEDEEVKRNCIMGESGMRDSDFFDSDSEIEEVESRVEDDEVKEKMPDREPKEDQMVNLIKFVSFGSQILNTKGIDLYYPTPIVPSLKINVEIPDENNRILMEKDSKNLYNSHIDARSGFSPRSKADKEMEISVCNSTTTDNHSESASGNDGNDGDTESVWSNTVIKPTSLDFPFDGEEEMPMEIEVGITDIIPGVTEESCKLSFDDEQEKNESNVEDYALVGASGASVDDKWQMSKQKRVLSSNTLFALNHEASRNTNNPKRRRFSPQSFKDACSIPEIPIGTEALDQIIQPLPRQYLVRDISPLIPSSSDNEGDKMLTEELECKLRNNSVFCNTASLPIPLLTPPQSPRTVDNNTVEPGMTYIEWPSNLVMDSAIIKAFANISTVSTASKKYEKLTINDSLSHREPAKSSSTSRARTISIETP